MSLDDTRLSDAIKTAIEGAFTVLDAAELQKLTDAIATAVVDELTDNADVSCVVGSGSSAGTWPGTIS